MFGRERIDFGVLLARAYNREPDVAERTSAMFDALASAVGAAVVAYYSRAPAGFVLDYLHLPAKYERRQQERDEAANDAPAPAGIVTAVRGASVVAPVVRGMATTTDLPIESLAPERIAAAPSLAEACVWEGPGGRMAWVPTGDAGVLFGPFDRERVAKRTVRDVAPAAQVAFALLRSVSEQTRLTSELRQEKQAAESATDVLASNLDMGALLLALIQQAARSSRHEGAFVGRRDSGKWAVDASVGMPDAFDTRVRVAGVNGLFELVELPGTTLVQPASVETQEAFGIRTLLLLPIEGDEGLIGVLGLANRQLSADAAEDYDAMAGFAEQIALVVAREEQLVRFSAAYEDTLVTLCQGLDLARGCPGHHERVAKLARSVCSRMDIPEEERRLVERAARVHDIGLLPSTRTPDDVLVEFQHPDMGRTLVTALPDGERLGRIVRQHHETFDGFGFPQALGGEALDPLGHVLAVAEWTIERATGNAVAPGLEPAKIAEELVGQESGARFSPQVAEAAADVLRRGHLFVVEEESDG